MDPKATKKSGLYGAIMLSADDRDIKTRRLSVVKNPESGSFTVMHLLNADVLPSFLEDDEITAQVVAFAVDVHFYENEDALAETIPVFEGSVIEELNGKKYCRLWDLCFQQDLCMTIWSEKTEKLLIRMKMMSWFR